MDNYTFNTKRHLEKIYRDSEVRKIGFQKNPNSVGVPHYIRVYAIMKSLCYIDFNSLIDIGGGYGYYPYIINKVFHKKCRNADLSLEACKLAKKAFNIDSDQVDIHHLPYKDNQFDVVLCSETLEHVTNYKTATKELIRIAKKAVIITVPNEPEAAAEYNRQNKVLHGHIHSFNSKSFDYLKSDQINIKYEPIENALLYFPDFLLRAEKIGYYKGRYPNSIFRIYNFFVPVLKHRLFQKFIKYVINKSVVSHLIFFDSMINKFLKLNHSQLFILYKEKPLSIPNKKLGNMNIRVLDL